MKAKIGALKAKIGAQPRWMLGGGAVAVAALVAGVVWMVSGSDSGSRIPPTRARVYSERQACLLTPGRGLADAAVVPVWAGMQDASVKTAAKVSYLAVAGEQSAANAAPFLATLAGRQCTVVLTVGAAPDGAVAIAGPKFPKTQFLVVGAHASGANVASLEAGPADRTRAAVESAVEAATRR